MTLSSNSILNYAIATEAGASSFLNASAGAVSLPSSGVTLNLSGDALETPGTYHLMSYSTISPLTPSTFTISGTLAGEAFTVQADPGSPNYLNLLISAIQTSGTWVNTSGGTWSNAGNWNSVTAPGGYALDTAVFGTAVTSGMAAVTLNGNRSLSSLTFSPTGGAAYAISPSSGTNFGLTFSNTGGAAATINNSSGNNTLAVAVTMSSNLSVTASTGSTLCVSGAIGDPSGTNTLSVVGGGTLILSGSNAYAGPTTVNASTLQVGNGTSGEYLNSPSVTMSNNATLEFNHADAYPGGYSGAISGSGQFVKAGSGSLTLNGVNSYSGPTTISGGTLVLGGSNLPTTTALSIAAAGALDLGGNSQTVGSLSGAAGAIIANNLVHPSHTYTSSLTVNPTSGVTTFAGNIVDSTLSSTTATWR